MPMKNHNKFSICSLDRISDFLSTKYKITIEIDISNTANNIGQEVANLHAGTIQLTKARTKEQQGFILAHVFGHLVQYLSKEKYQHLLEKVEDGPPIYFDTQTKKQYFMYEMEAFAWGEALMRECMPISNETTHRYRTYACVDYAIYLFFLKTGLHTNENKFQTLYTESLKSKKRELWNSSELILPQSLIFENINISVV